VSGRQVAIDLYPGTGLRPADARQIAVEAEQAGFAGLWTLEAGTEPFLPLALAAEHTTCARYSGPGSAPRPPPISRCPARSW